MSLTILPTTMSGAWRKGKMELATKIIYLGLLLFCAGVFYYKGYKDGTNETSDNIIKFVTEYDKTRKRIITKNEKH